MSIKTIIIGKGHLGTILAKAFDPRSSLWINKEAPRFMHWTDDLSKLDTRVLAGFQPDYVINAAGKTDLPWCEANKDECWRCNVIEPVMLQRRLPKHATLIHLSSGCVWTGPFRDDGQPFEPMDAPTPACFYAWTKVASDAQLMMEAENDLRQIFILRPRQVFSPADSPRNTLSKLLSYKRLIDTPNSMTSSDLIAEVIRKIIYPVVPRARERRIMNVYNSGITSPFLVGRMLAKAGLREEPELMLKSELDDFHKPRRVDVVMFDQYFNDYFEERPVDRALESAINEYAKNLKP